MTDGMKACPACGQEIRVEAILCRHCQHRLDAPAAGPARRSGLLIAVIVIAVVVGGIFVVAIVAAIAIPGLVAAGRASNERNASASLKTITTAQADFRANDRDGNLVSDFWTADVFALYGLIPVPAGDSALPPDGTDGTRIIKLIEPSVAAADGLSRTGLYGNVTFGASIVSGSPKAGYVCRAFGADESGTLGEDTDGPGLYGTSHSRARYAFATMPETRSAGKQLFIVNQDNTIWMYNLPGTYRLQFTPIAGTSDSSSSVTGTGQRFFDFGGPGTGVYPANPGAAGCGRHN